MKLSFFVCSVVLAFAGNHLVYAASPTEADAFFQKKLYEKALEQYSATLEKADLSVNARTRAVERAATCEALLGRYAEAAQRLLGASLPTESSPEAQRLRGVLLLLRAETGREYLQRYGHRLPQDVEEGTRDVTRWTRARWQSEIRKSYAELWKNRAALVATRIQEASDLIDLMNADVEAIPTLWDFAIYRWTTYLLRESVNEDTPATGKAPHASSVIVKHYEVAPNLAALSSGANLSPGEQAAALEEDAANLSRSGRPAAVELWRVSRLTLPFHDPARFRLPESDETRKALHASAILILRDWYDTFLSARARARAGFEAASLLNEDGQFEEAVKLCQQVEHRLRGTPEAASCAGLRAQITQPQISITALTVPVGGAGALMLNARNVDEVYFRAVPTTVDELNALAKKNGNARWQDWSALRWIDTSRMKTFLARKPVREWSTKLSPKSPHEPVKATVDFPGAEIGLYVLLASDEPKFAPGTSLLQGAIVNVTDLMLVGSAGLGGNAQDPIATPGSAFELYLLDADTGTPVTGASLDTNWWDWQSGEHQRLTTAADGHARFTHAWQGDRYGHTIDTLASRGKGVAYWSGPLSQYFTPPSPYELHVETDRPIYRPGQKVQVKVTVLKRVPRGYQVLPNETMNLKILDANYQAFGEKALRLDAMGSAATTFDLPGGKLLGSYSFSAQVSEGGKAYSGQTSFAVEEYKRPDFEVKLKDSNGAWQYGKPVQVRGEARYYFGGAVAAAPIHYRISRERYLPWFCWWWRGIFPGGDRTEVASGQAKTDDTGAFAFDFIPAAPPLAGSDASHDFPSNYIVEVDARDPGGRTITASSSYRAGPKAYLFNVPMPAGFIARDRHEPLTVKLVDLNEHPAESQGSYEIVKVELPLLRDENAGERRGGVIQPETLEKQLEHASDGAKVATGPLALGGEKGAQVPLEGLEEGVYRLKLKAKDAWGGEVAQAIPFIVVDPTRDRAGFSLEGVALSERSSYQVGENARFLIGSGRINGPLFVEIWTGSYLNDRRQLPSGGVQLLSIPVTDALRGGFSVRWFGAERSELRGGEATVEVPRAEKELKLALVHDAALAPGQKAHWTLSAKDASGKPVQGEATVRVFDRSLEYYAKSQGSWVKGLYPGALPLSSQDSSVGDARFASFPQTEGWMQKILEAFASAGAAKAYPALRATQGHLAWGFGRHMRNEAVDLAAPSPSAANSMALDAVAVRKSKAAPEAKAVPEGKEPAVTPRTNFAETAFFGPQLAVSNGQTSFDFTAPEALTSWKIESTVLTADASWGALQAETVTRKDLMVQIEMPRFLREGDQGQVRAVVHNETDHELSGDVKLQAADLVSSPEAQPFHLKPHAQAAFGWSAHAPTSVREISVRAIARAGQFSDAEEKPLPILPSRQRLIESKVVALDGSSKAELKLPSFDQPDLTRVNERLELQIDPQLALTVLNSLPFLVRYPYECTEQVLDRFVPSGIVASFYARYPALAEAVKKIPKRTTVTPAWDTDDPRRMMQLMETPWLAESKGRAAGGGELIDLLDASKVAAERDRSLTLLRSYQLSDGGFPWFPGGRADPYMTLVVLAGFAEASRYGVEVPIDVRNAALQYVLREIPLRRSMKPDAANVSLTLYAAYVVTSFMDSNPPVPSGHSIQKLARAWIDSATRYDDAMTPLGKAWAANVLWRLGDTAKGDSFLDRALDGAREDPIAGVYWTPEKISWLWYNDTVEKHAFFLKTLQEHRPNDKRIGGMVKWLLMNRKGNEWKSTKASAAAIYALLDVMKARGSLSQGDEFTVKWTGHSDAQVSIGPLDYLAKPLRWSETGAEIHPEKEKITVEKRGPGYAFASLIWLFSTEELPKEAVSSGLIAVDRKFFLREKVGSEYRLKPLDDGAMVRVGDEVETQLTIRAKSAFDYVHLKDPRAAGFEASTLLSGWKFDSIGRYEEPRDSLTDFFMDWLPHGEYLLKYRMRATTPGQYRVGPAVLQSMYAPEMNAYSAGFKIKVQE